MCSLGLASTTVTYWRKSSEVPPRWLASGAQDRQGEPESPGFVQPLEKTRVCLSREITKKGDTKVGVFGPEKLGCCTDACNMEVK